MDDKNEKQGQTGKGRKEENNNNHINELARFDIVRPKKQSQYRIPQDKRTQRTKRPRKRQRLRLRLGKGCSE